MPPDVVVKTIGVVSDVICCFRMIGIVLLPNPLHLQIQEGPLYRGALTGVY